jgi:NAD(P)-dependent dehydrogenase (short-subunit alcohol dehydrogenase family)
MNDIQTLFSLKDKRIAITGGAGVLCASMARFLGTAGAKLAILDIMDEAAGKLAEQINAAGGQAEAIHCNVLETESVNAACAKAVESLGAVDVLINGAGGNKKEATAAPPTTFFELPIDAFEWVFKLNCIGTVLPSQVFGRHMAERGEGTIINVSSMSAFRSLTRVGAYSAAKAAISNFTGWLSVYMCERHSKQIRVNAIAPGFFLTEQNRFLLTDEKTGELTERGRQILDNTPMERFGDPEDLHGTLAWLLSDAAKFVTGVVVPIDGGFNAFAGV